MNEGFGNRRVSLSAFIAHKIAAGSAEKPLTDEHLDGFVEFEHYVKTNGMAEAKSLREWGEWYDAYWVEEAA